MSYLENTRWHLAEVERILADAEAAVEEHPEFSESMEPNIWSLKKLRDQFRAQLAACGECFTPSPSLDAGIPPFPSPAESDARGHL